MSWIDEVRNAISDPAAAGVAGSLLSLQWVPGATWKTKMISFLCGMACAIYVTPTLLDALDVRWHNSQSLFAFLLGLLGMNLLAKLGDFVSKTSIADLIAALRGGGAKP